MLQWFSTFFQSATAWMPRYEKVPPTFRMVKWSACREATLHGPGIIWFWPIVTEKEDVDIRWKSMVTHVQSITLADGTPISARTMTRWRPGDVIKVVTSEEDYTDTVAETAQSVLVDVLSGLSREMLTQSAAINATFTMAMKKEMAEIGIEIQKCKFTELVVSPAFRIINDGG